MGADLGACVVVNPPREKTHCANFHEYFVPENCPLGAWHITCMHYENVYIRNVYHLDYMHNVVGIPTEIFHDSALLTDCMDVPETDLFLQLVVLM